MLNNVYLNFIKSGAKSQNRAQNRTREQKRVCTVCTTVHTVRTRPVQNHTPAKNNNKINDSTMAFATLLGINNIKHNI